MRLRTAAHWTLRSAEPEASGFWDAIAFWDQKHGVLLGDPVKGRFVVLRTNDGGRHWKHDESAGLEADGRGESVFAASNSALALGADGTNIHFVTGGAGGGRVFCFRAGTGSTNGGWSAVRLPFSFQAESGGMFSIGFRDRRHGVAVGGNYKEPHLSENTAAWTADGGLNWTAAAHTPGGYRSAVAWYGVARVWMATGPTGTDVSTDDGKTWKSFSKAGWNALSLPWAVGADGRIGKMAASASATRVK